MDDEDLSREAGDPVCWLRFVCPECGQMQEGPLTDRCPHCGAALDEGPSGAAVRDQHSGHGDRGEGV